MLHYGAPPGTRSGPSISESIMLVEPCIAGVVDLASDAEESIYGMAVMVVRRGYPYQPVNTPAKQFCVPRITCAQELLPLGGCTYCKHNELLTTYLPACHAYGSIFPTKFLPARRVDTFRMKRLALCR
jgi:hypothetical protein